MTLETLQRVPDGAGGHQGIWTPLGQIWASVRPGTGRETSGQDVALSRLGVRITVRGAVQGAPSRPRAGQRFREGGRLFVIDAVSETQDGRFLTCNAHEELAI
ncbi:head-tail adaptor protein [Oceaniglobus indicus]|uniref:head-tail adaptor protein n=1 Tax=Oceaniglobus indicus TaxID=2047749 RepID=UPI001F4E9AA2|nr:head-tail adaptor protein [Oceaniglobus indicus]